MEKVKVLVLATGETKEVPRTSAGNIAYMRLEDVRKKILLGELESQSGKTKEQLLEMVEIDLGIRTAKKPEPKKDEEVKVEWVDEKPKRTRKKKTD